MSHKQKAKNSQLDSKLADAEIKHLISRCKLSSEIIRRDICPNCDSKEAELCDFMLDLYEKRGIVLTDGDITIKMSGMCCPGMQSYFSQQDRLRG